MTPLDWMMAGDTGVSSETIMHVMEGTQPPEGTDVPYDRGDFGRCHRLLELFPHYRHRLREVADKYPIWVGFVREWPGLTDLYESGKAEQLNDAMRPLVEEGRLADGWRRTDLGWQHKALDLVRSEVASEIDAIANTRTCVSCGCTEDDCSGCIERTGEACYWVDDDLCSACVRYGSYFVAAIYREGDPSHAPYETELWTRKDADAFVRNMLVSPDSEAGEVFMQGGGDAGMARPDGTVVYLTYIEQNPLNIKRYSFDDARRAVILRKHADDLDLAADVEW